MINQLIWDAGFKKAYKKKSKNNKEWKNNFWESVELFKNNSFHPSLQTHKLSGKLKGLWAFSCDYDCRVVLKFIDSDSVLLIDIGKHDEVY